MEPSTSKRRSAAVPPSSSKGLRACLHCKLIKSAAQFRETGCENCGDMSGDLSRDTTPVFQGMVSMMSPKDSWVARWLRQDALARGVYAIQVSRAQDEAEEDDELSDEEQN